LGSTFCFFLFIEVWILSSKQFHFGFSSKIFLFLIKVNHVDFRTKMGHSSRQTPSSTSESPITRAEEMKIFYADASFTSRSRCNQMLIKCKGDVARALEELKIERLVDIQIAPNNEKAREALSARAWNLNAAAELLLSNTCN
uniref:UBA domain-containing protein n=1 Tax=Angiostrongylus costaricensis TaxID=334426 RepID=A0A0R3PXH7_ANGCS